MTSMADRLTDLVVRINRRRKLLAIGFAVLMPVFVLSGVVVHDSMGEIAFAEKELAGTDYLRRTWNVLSVCDAGITPSRASFGATATNDAISHLETEGAAIAATLSSGPKTCDSARAFLRRIADDTNLMLDPKPDTYYLMHAAVIDLPALSGHSARHHGSDIQVERIAESSQAVDDSLQRAVRVGDRLLTAAVSLHHPVARRQPSRRRYRQRGR